MHTLVALHTTPDFLSFSLDGGVARTAACTIIALKASREGSETKARKRAMLG
jgi:hypothetical protein